MYGGKSEDFWDGTNVKISFYHNKFDSPGID